MTKQTSLNSAYEGVGDRLAKLQQQNAELKQALRAALDWIDAVPGTISLPTMPGFDRDWAEGLLEQSPDRYTADQMHEYARVALSAQQSSSYPSNSDESERQADLSVTDAYEAAAQVCDRLKSYLDQGGGEYQPGERLGQVARMIRKLKNNGTSKAAQPDRQKGEQNENTF